MSGNQTPRLRRGATEREYQTMVLGRQCRWRIIASVIYLLALGPILWGGRLLLTSWEAEPALGGQPTPPPTHPSPRPYADPPSPPLPTPAFSPSAESSTLPRQGPESVTSVQIPLSILDGVAYVPVQ